MPPAARFGDMHTCPLVTGPVPHVGGPILPPGCPTVLIGFQPAARVTDLAACVGPPDSVAKGSPTVLIGNLMAARLGDLTVHGGVIVQGFPTVLIGEAGGGTDRPFGGLQAAATRRPTPAEIQEIQDAIDAGDNQRAIDLAIQYYGIDVSNVANGVQYDPTETNYGTTDFDGDVRLGPLALTSPEVLASTLVHETTHANQAAALRADDPSLTDWPTGDDAANFDEAMAFDAELRSAHNTGLVNNPDELQLAAERRTEHFSDLPPDDQIQFENGDYPP
jgi:uncharacterized Zn-binding protein involved in type VI secretion